MAVAIKVRSYPELIQALDGRRRALGMTMLDMDDRSGLTGGYSAKLFCGMRRFGEMSLPVVLDTLQCDLLVLPRNQDAAPARVERRTGSCGPIGSPRPQSEGTSSL
jgi:hypothetical protein